jgi:hypothetical protein
LFFHLQKLTICRFTYLRTHGKTPWDNVDVDDGSHHNDCAMMMLVMVGINLTMSGSDGCDKRQCGLSFG